MSSSFAAYPSLKNMPVVISGGATGIGEALVKNFAAQGAKVGFVDIASDEGTALADTLNAGGHTAKFIKCDVTDTHAYRGAIDALADAHGDALALVNNAAHDERHKWEDMTPEYWDDRIAVNLKHHFFAIQAVAPGMIKAGKGSVINFGSISWMILAGNMAGYTASKAAVHGLTRSLARDLGPHKIRLNTLVPGWVMTPRQLKYWVGEEEMKQIRANQALPDHVMPDDLARMALFLASDDSKMISAQDFLVDGGWAHA